MEKVKVYNLNEYIIKECGKQTFRNDKIMIVVGDNGVVIRDYEGCGWDENLVTDSITVQLNDYTPKENGKYSIYIMPQYETHIPIQEIIENAECEEMYLKEFMHKWNYNSRCSANFRETLDSIKHAGIDFKIYLDEEN